jgi:hypothetical protein
MATIPPISSWIEIVQQFFPIFTQPTTQVFLRLTIGWILCTGRRTITGILPLADPLGLRSHDIYHRFFPDAHWDLLALWNRLAGFLIRTFAPSGTILLDLDDTLFHRTGRKVEGAGWWRDAVRSTRNRIVYGWGLNLVILTLRVTPPWGGMPLGLPIGMKVHHKDGDSLTDLALQMLREVSEALPERVFRVHADGFYASLAGHLPPQVHLISRIRRDAVLYDLPPQRRPHQRGRSRKRGRRLPCPEQRARQIRSWKRVQTCERGHKRIRLVYTQVVLGYKVSQTPMLLVISRDPEGKERDDFFLSTDLTLAGGIVIGGFAGRWCIEETNRNVKQYLGGQQPQTWKGRGPERAAAMSLVLYAWVWTWFLQRNNGQQAWTDRPWYASKETPSFRDALTALRQTLWQPRINSMFDSRAEQHQNLKLLMKLLSEAA